ncbi:hypothetical protein HPB51_015725 [Rhipicephalus microplus]|uniref:Uncharacterized protein n=1 Tax=Rhipicephalus microplus TaxID=6941 RepID=A0A9J6EUB4_RHIMP|nr:hypothetical protein HPB51_015725 [Rhipicephalus microplus]
MTRPLLTPVSPEPVETLDFKPQLNHVWSQHSQGHPLPTADGCLLYLWWTWPQSRRVPHSRKCYLSTLQMTSPGDQHVCAPKCAFCGGPYPTADRTYTQRFEMPYMFRQRRREIRDFDKDFPPIGHLSEAANKSRSQSRSSKGRSRYRSGPRSTSRSQSRSSSRSRSLAASIQVPAATAPEWADRVKRSQKQVTGGKLPEQNNDRIIQLERENAALKEAVAQIRVEMVALKNANNAYTEASQRPQVTRLKTPVTRLKHL